MVWQQLSKPVNKAQSTSFPRGKHANLLLCLQLRCIICSGDNSAHKDTCVCAAHPNYCKWHSLTNVDGLVCNYGNSRSLGLCGDFDWHRPPELKISQGWLPCFVTALLSLPLNAVESSCSPSRELMPWKTPLQSQQAFLWGERGQKIFWYGSFQQLPLIHLSQCPVNITLPVWAHTSTAWPRRMVPLTTLSQLACCPCNLLSQSSVAVYPVEDYMEMSGDCWVNTLTCTWGTGAQQINHWQLDTFVPFKWLRSTATLSARDIDLVSQISLWYGREIKTTFSISMRFSTT